MEKEKKIPRQSTQQLVGGGGEGVLPYISCRGMCRPKEYGFLHHSGLESGMVFEETAGVYEHINRFNSMAK